MGTTTYNYYDDGWILEGSECEYNEDWISLIYTPDEPLDDAASFIRLDLPKQVIIKLGEKLKKEME